MKSLLVLMVLVLSGPYAAASSCPDFSGIYIEEESSMVLYVNQFGCVRARTDFVNRKCETYTNQLIFDGEEYMVPGSLTNWQSHIIEQDGIYGQRSWVESGKTLYAKIRMYLDSKNALIQEYSPLDEDGNIIETVVRKFVSAFGESAPEIPSCKQKIKL